MEKAENLAEIQNEKKTGLSISTEKKLQSEVFGGQEEKGNQ